MPAAGCVRVYCCMCAMQAADLTVTRSDAGACVRAVHACAASVGGAMLPCSGYLQGRHCQTALMQCS